MKRFLPLLLLIVSFSCSHPKPVIQPTTINIIENALKSVVHVKGKDVNIFGEMTEYGCSAWSYAPRKFITAAHCVGSDMKIEDHPVFAVKTDTTEDLAVLVADVVKPSLTLREAPVTRLEEVTGLGYGFSWEYPTVTFNKVLMFDYTPFPDEVYPGIWFQGGFIGGMSGGAVIDKDGMVISIVQRGNESIGYGVSAKTILDFINK